MFMGLGLPLTAFGSRGVVSDTPDLNSSLALRLLGGSSGLALAFDDSTWQATTGFYGSAAIVGGGTSDGYNTAPDTAAASLVSYTSPSVKSLMGPSGTLRFNAHNLFLNSASPANQSVTVVSGATYAIILTGSVTTTLSGAATGTITAGTTNITAATTTLTFGSTSGTGTVQVTRTPADLTYLATAGSVRYALPYEWSTAGVLQGIRVEEARTNLLVRSQEFDNASWSRGNILSVTANSFVSPDGTSTADLVIPNTTSATHTIDQPSATTASAATHSVYVRPAGYTKVALKESATLGEYASFQLTGAGSILDSTCDSASIEFNSSTGFYRISMVVSSATTQSFRFFFLPPAYTSGDPNGAAGTFAGDGTSGAYLWGAQLESGSFGPTSYIPTIGSTVTRAADNISLATSAFPYSATASTWFSYAENSQVASIYGTNTLIGGQAINIAEMRVTSSTQVQQVGSGDLFATGTVGSGSTTSIKAAFAVASNDFAAVANGGTAATDTSGTPATMTTLSVGSRSGTSIWWNGIIKQIVYFPTRKTNAELQQLTSA